MKSDVAAANVVAATVIAAADVIAAAFAVAPMSPNQMIRKKNKTVIKELLKKLTTINIMGWKASITMTSGKVHELYVAKNTNQHAKKNTQR